MCGALCGAVVAAVMAGAAWAQDITVEPLPPIDQSEPTLEYSPLPQDEFVTEETQVEVSTGTGAVIRVLDRVSGQVAEIDLPNNTKTGYQRIEIALGECRFPTDDPASDAFAYLTVTNVGEGDVAFAGWMIASSPALSALDHPRYDVWVIRCTNA